MSAPRQNGGLALAFAGIAAYTAWRAVDAERRRADPEAGPLSEHVVETAKGDLDALRSAIGGCLRRASDRVARFADEVSATTDRPAAGAAHGAAEEIVPKGASSL